MAIGFSDGVAQRIPDRSLTRKATPKVLIASFGDGYEQRLPLGINSIGEEYTVTFKTRPKADVDDMVSFFANNKGANSFSFTLPDTNGAGSETTIKVVCYDYTLTYEYDNYYTLEASLRRVYEP